MHVTVAPFHQGQVAVVGDVMLDRYWHGGTSRISPEAPVPVVRVEQIDDRPGGAANVALNIAALGGASVLAGLCGEDEMANTLRRQLESAGVRPMFRSCAPAPTITKLRVISRHQQLLRMDFEDPLPEAAARALTEIAESLLSDCGALILSDYGKGTLTDCQPWIVAARKRGVPVLVDPKGTDFERYRGATLLTPNLGEFEAVAGRCRSEAELVEKGQALISRFGLEALLITRSEQGMTLLRPGEPELHLPALAREVFDVTGAGDTVIATLGAALAAGSSLPQAVALANLAASLVVAKLGTATISGAELRAAVSGGREAGFGAMAADQLQIALEAARHRKEKVVFTNGCFDILHAGHVGYLEQARKLGDRLVVALNGDASVTRLKGEGRPVNPLERRMTVVAGLEAVDWVTWFDEDTPENLLRQLQPDILVKGGDYQKEQVVGWEIVEGYGGTVQALDFLDNCSTTAIVRKIRGDSAKP